MLLRDELFGVGWGGKGCGVEIVDGIVCEVDDLLGRCSNACLDNLRMLAIANIKGSPKLSRARTRC